MKGEGENPGERFVRAEEVFSPELHWNWSSSGEAITVARQRFSVLV